MASQAGAIAAGALDADQLDFAEGPKPSEQTAVAGRCGLEGLHAEQATTVVQSGGDVHVEVGVDTSVIRSGIVVIGHPFDRKWWGGHHTSRDDGQDSDGPLRQAPSRSLRPNR
jgi:hypothetical protein